MKFRFGANLHFVGRCFTCTCSSCSSGWFPETPLPSRSTPVETEWDWKTGEGRRARNSSIGGSFFHSESVNCESMNLRNDYFYIYIVSQVLTSIHKGKNSAEEYD